MARFFWWAVQNKHVAFKKHRSCILNMYIVYMYTQIYIYINIFIVHCMQGAAHACKAPCVQKPWMLLAHVLQCSTPCNICFRHMCFQSALYNALFGRVTWLQCCMFDNFKRCRACPHEPYDAVAWVTLSCAVVCRLYDIPSAVELPKAPCVVCNMNARTLLRSRRFQDENNHAQPFQTLHEVS